MNNSGVFYDMLNVTQDHGVQLPLIGDKGRVNIDLVSGKMDEHVVGYPHKHVGSHNTIMQIVVSGSEVRINANPSRYNRTDNLFGFTTLKECFAVYNQQLEEFGLPPFTPATYVKPVFCEHTRRYRTVSDGAIIREVHLTTNHSVGKGNEDVYLKALSGQPYRNSIGRLHTNGKTCDWLTKSGNGGSLIYPSVYNKAHELGFHAMAKAKRTGDDIAIHKLQKVINYCIEKGVVRKESKVKNAQLSRSGFRYYGTFNEEELKQLHKPLMIVGERLQVENMKLETISNELIRNGIVSSTRAANTTALYAYEWMHGAIYSPKKSQTRLHRTRLRKIGIDIANPCNLSTFSPMIIRESKIINIESLPIPEWYKMPQVA